MPLTLTRTLHLTNPLQHGDDVKSVQHLLNAKGFPVDADGWYGPETAAACVDAKKRLKYPKAAQVPSCGQSLVDALEAHAPFKPLPLPAPRTRYVSEWRSAIAASSGWDYAKVRPIPHPGHHGRVVTDCSGAVTYLAELAGLTDPNGFRYNGQGYTGSLLNHCSQISHAMIRPGDLVVWGRFPGHHTAAVLTTGADPDLGSHGRQGDPRSVTLSAETAAQAVGGHTQVTYLRWLP